MDLTVVIPTLNEARYLPGTLEAVRDRADATPPVVVADCGSVDATVAIAREHGAEVIVDPALENRGEAANAGAERAGSKNLLFLDADTRPPRGYDTEIAAALERPGVVGGAFEISFDGTGFALRVVEWVDRLRYRSRQLYYGDQGVFVSAAAFSRVGGFPPVSLFESAELCRCLKRHGRLVLIRSPVETSSRRFEKGGVWRVFAHDLRLWWLHLVGRRFERFGPAYWKENRLRGEADEVVPWLRDQRSTPPRGR